ncbi:MAG TPA: LPS export ABC transporter periplasmic protein LptC [Gammaproteobacteria bacterium]|jgi:lipopolysaccharide export system protein LptC|nr:LPS export ABC transporter periplasmic protein LptC [Gammaproteobacteria bacterium]HIM99490.1 LPS export ABC transporter periplasmic protein LptC [Gammaproteobacteria bacterium]
MADRHLEQAVLVATIAVMFGLSLWLQMNFLKPTLPQIETVISHEPDYYIHKFTATGRDANGIAYVLEAKRLAHFPDDNTALLDEPRLVQYEQDTSSRTTSSDSGLVYENGTKILLQGNVQVTQGATDTAVGSVTSADRMTIKLR